MQLAKVHIFLKQSLCNIAHHVGLILYYHKWHNNYINKGPINMAIKQTQINLITNQLTA
jgi:hypothetical protein